jgi:hypothetical protein
MLNLDVVQILQQKKRLLKLCPCHFKVKLALQRNAERNFSYHIMSLVLSNDSIYNSEQYSLF